MKWTRQKVLMLLFGAGGLVLLPVSVFMESSARYPVRLMGLVCLLVFNLVRGRK